MMAVITDIIPIVFETNDIDNDDNDNNNSDYSICRRVNVNNNLLSRFHHI